jgi:hypothetical protein
MTVCAWLSWSCAIRGFDHSKNYQKIDSVEIAAVSDIDENVISRRLGIFLFCSDKFIADFPACKPDGLDLVSCFRLSHYDPRLVRRVLLFRRDHLHRHRDYAFAVIRNNLQHRRCAIILQVANRIFACRQHDAAH